MANNRDFKWRRFEEEIILWAVGGYCRYGISYPNLQEMMQEKGITVNHTTLYRWVQIYYTHLQSVNAAAVILKVLSNLSPYLI